MKRMYIIFSPFAILLIFFAFYGNTVFAKTDLSISETDITFSKDIILPGDNVTIYGRVFNLGDTDVSGYVDFMDNGKEISSPQPISLKPNTYDDVFVGWKPAGGNHNITAKIIGINSTDDNPQNNITVKKEVIVSVDHNGTNSINQNTDTNQNALTDKTSSTLSSNSSALTNSIDKSTSSMFFYFKSATDTAMHGLQSSIDNSIVSADSYVKEIVDNHAKNIQKTFYNLPSTLLPQITQIKNGQNYFYIILGLILVVIVSFLLAVFKKKKKRRR